jgi:hypothetical protein
VVRIRVLGQEGNIRANLVLFEGFWIVKFKFQMKETWANLGLFEEGGGGGLNSSKAIVQFGAIIG